jgi:hypothetical protein
MRPTDVRNLIRFSTRMSMFICPNDRAGVVAFLHGYEYAVGGECRFTAVLSEHLARRHQVKGGPLGWAHQIAQLAERRELDWMEAYLLISSEVLNAAAEAPDAEPSTDADTGRPFGAGCS